LRGETAEDGMVSPKTSAACDTTYYVTPLEVFILTQKGSQQCSRDPDLHCPSLCAAPRSPSLCHPELDLCPW